MYKSSPLDSAEYYFSYLNASHLSHVRAKKRNAADASLNDGDEKVRKRRQACGECSPCRVKQNCDRYGLVRFISLSWC